MRISPRLIVATISLLSALAIGCQQVDTSAPQGTSQSAAEANGQGAQQGGPNGAKAPSIPQLLLRESIEELKANGELNAAVENIKQSLQSPEEQARSTQRALDKALASQFRSGSADAASLEAAISAAEQAHRDADASTAQALEDARALLSAAQRKSVVERVKSRLPKPEKAPQGAAGEQPPQNGQEPPPQGAPAGGGQAGPPPGGEQGGKAGAPQGAPGAGMGPEGPDPLLQGIELSEEQKAQLKELMPPPKDDQQPKAAPPPEGAQAGAPPELDGAQSSPPPGGSASPKGPPPGGDKVAADKLLEAFASDAEELPAPPAPPEGAISPLRHRMEFLVNLGKVLTEEQRDLVADRLERPWLRG